MTLEEYRLKSYKPKLDVMTLMPDHIPKYMGGAWYSCVEWAIMDSSIIHEFIKQTNLKWTPSKYNLHKIVKDADDLEINYIKQFIKWVNLNIWRDKV